jgi:SAM-dependent methyltransferase
LVDGRLGDVPLDDARRANQQNWEDRVPIHAASRGYDLSGLAASPTRLSQVVSRERDMLPDLHGRDVVHLQCHIGTDTISLARLGAKSVTGYDFSPAALGVARDLARAAHIDAAFIEGELYDAADVLGDQSYDVVYTGTGALCWLPDIRGWAIVVARLLRPGGIVHLNEFHPVLFSLDERVDDDLRITYPYFETEESIVFDDGPATYTDGDATSITHTVTHEWNHGLGEVVQAVLDAGLSVVALREFPHCASAVLPRMMVERVSDGATVLREHPERAPLSYILQAVKPDG